jgi:hypothetical protein
VCRVCTRTILHCNIHANSVNPIAYFDKKKLIFSVLVGGDNEDDFFIDYFCNILCFFLLL